MTSNERPAFDWKGAGYLTSTISVLFLGWVAWPAPQEPQWKAIAVIVGMATSVLGMAMRYVSHLQQQREVRKAKAEAQASPEPIGA